MNLNNSLMRAKLVPLLRTGLVDRITVVARRAGPALPGVRYVVAPERGGALRRTSSLLYTLLRTSRQDRPDIVMAYNLIPFGIMGLISARIARVPFGMNIIGGAAEIVGGGFEVDSNRLLARLKRPSRVLERLMSWFVKRADFVTTTGSRTRDFLVGDGVDPSVLHEIASAIEPAEFHSASRATRWDLVCVSGLYPNKRIEALLEIVVELRLHKADLQVAIVGDGPLRLRLTEKIRQLGLEHHVHLLGFQTDVREILWSSKIFVMTSRAEGLPLSVLEAAACGVPVVVCDFGDIRDLIEDGVNGRLIAIENMLAFRAALLEMIGNAQQRVTFAAAAQKAVYARYTIDSATTKWRLLLNRLAPA